MFPWGPQTVILDSTLPMAHYVAHVYDLFILVSILVRFLPSDGFRPTSFGFTKESDKDGVCSPTDYSKTGQEK